MEKTTPFLPGKKLALLAFFSALGYILLFLIFGSEIGPAIAYLSTVPVLLIGWAFGLSAGLVAGVLSIPINILLFYQIGIPGLDVVFRVESSTVAVLSIFLGGAAGIVHRLTKHLAKQVSISRASQETLQSIEENYRKLFNGIPIGIYRTTPGGQVLAANPALVTLFGYRDEEDLRGLNVFDLFPDPEERKSWQKMIESEGVVHGYEYQIRRKDGTLLWVEDHARSIHDRNGQVLCYEGSLTDITERQRTELALHTSQAQLSNAVRIAHLGPWEYDVVSDIFTFNDPFYAMFRTTAEQVGGYTSSSAEYARQFVYPDDASIVSEEIRKALETDDPEYSRELEHRIRYADGEVGYIHVRFYIVKDERGHTVKAFGANQDITERKHAEAVRESLLTENRRQKDLLECIIQETPAGIAILEGSDHRYSLANPGYLEFVHGKGDICGRTVADVWPETIGELQPLLDQVYQTGEAFHAVDMPFPMIRDRGPETAYFTYTYSPLIGEKGTIDRVLVTAQETTDQIKGRQHLEKELAERKRIEAALRESEQRYVGLFEDSPVSLWEEDFSDVKRYLDALKHSGISDLGQYIHEHPDIVEACLGRVRVVDVNQEAVAMFHAQSKTELLENFYRIFLPESVDIFRQELLAIARDERVFEGEGRNGTLDGEVLDIFLRWSIAPGNEISLARVFVSILDISRRKKAEALAKKQAAQTEVLAELASALSVVSLDSRAIYEIITTHTCRLMGDACVLTLLSEDRGFIMIAGFHHVNPNVIDQFRGRLSSERTPLSEAAANWVVQTGKSLIIPSFSADKNVQIHDPGYLEYLDQYEVESLMIVPILNQDQIIGTLGVMRDCPGASYSVEDLSLLRYLATQAALPIINARLHERIRQQAHTDPLTGVPNRRYFSELAELEFQRTERYGHALSMIMVDIDHFKDINDTYGHDVGDQVLQLVAGLCHTTTRSVDLVGRYGGDEFLILLLETDLETARSIAERLRLSIGSSPMMVGKNSIRTTVSLGVANKCTLATNLSQLIHLADQAMYQSKQAGRNQVRTSDMG